MAGLLVSVRSAEEARAALRGGATVIDVKDPDRGPLGRASIATWRAVRAAVPDGVPVSVALGELCQWEDLDPPSSAHYQGIAFRKLGLAHAGPNWRSAWSAIDRANGQGPPWIAVAYADWVRANAPDPEAILDAAIAEPSCAGVLVDTWDKSRPSPIEDSPRWRDWIDRARNSGRTVAIAGRLDLASIDRLLGLNPDLFGVRGAACVGGHREGTVDSRCVADLARVASRGGPRP